MSHLVVRACTAAALVASLSVLNANSCHAHGDVWVYADVDSTLSLGLADETGTDFEPALPIYEAILTPDTLPFSPFDSSAADPGFMAAAGDLPPSQPMALTAGPLTVWNGSSLVPAEGVSFSFDLSTALASSPAGALHEHPPFGLVDLTADPLPIPDGVYVATFRLSTAGLGESETGYFLMLHDALITDEANAEELGELLEEYENGGPAPVFAGKDFRFFEEVHGYVEGTIPEPSCAALGAFAVLGLTAAGRRIGS